MVHRCRRALLAGVVLAVIPCWVLAAGSSFKIDPIHSSIVFRIKHMDMGYIYGRFNEFSGTVGWDAATPQTSSFDVTIKAASVDTGNSMRDAHLRKPDFFSATEFPTITFKSTKVEAGADKKLKVTGDLTMHGVTRPVTAEIEVTGEGDRGPMFGYRVGVEGKFVLKRSDFGMSYALQGNMLGDEVTVMFAFEAARQ